MTKPKPIRVELTPDELACAVRFGEKKYLAALEMGLLFDGSADDQEEWLAIRKEAGLKIDPGTAEVTWTFARILDPYGVGDVPPEYDCVGRVYFARSPASRIWVCFYDLPDGVAKRLHARADRGGTGEDPDRS